MKLIIYILSLFLNIYKGSLDFPQKIQYYYIKNGGDMFVFK